MNQVAKITRTAGLWSIHAAESIPDADYDRAAALLTRRLTVRPDRLTLIPVGKFK